MRIRLTSRDAWILCGVFLASAWVAPAQTTSVVNTPAQTIPAHALPDEPTPGQPLPTQPAPIAIISEQGVKLDGNMTLADGRATIARSGSITAGEHTATVTLPGRGNLRICATTKVSLTADSSVPAIAASSASEGQMIYQPGLMMALESGALEANFATGRNSDVILTPDFRILISGPGVAAVQVRLGPKGDTCVDNRGPDAPYVTVSSIFEGGVYRVQADQRVMFQHGSLREVVDVEKESCGCPEEPKALPQGNEFPLAQSAGLAPSPLVAGNTAPTDRVAPLATAQLSYDGTKRIHQDEDETKKDVPPAAEPPLRVTHLAAPAAAKPEAGPEAKAEPKRGFFRRVGRFFRKLFGG